jgi:hypothetical protein
LDDGRAVLHPIRAGWRWTGDCLEYCKRWAMEDEGVTPLERTKRVLEATMAGLDTQLTFTMETEEDYKDNWLPTLDTNIRVEEDNKIVYKFYEKPMQNNTVLHKTTAMPEDNKIRCLSNDLIRRMLNTTELLEDNIRCKIVDDYAQKLFNSGYGLAQVRRIVMSGLKGYEAKLLESRTAGGRSLHQQARESSARRQRKKLTAKSDWFRPEGKTAKNKEMPTRDNQYQDGSEGGLDDIRSGGGSRRQDGTAPPKKDTTMKGKRLKNTMNEKPRTTSVMFVEQTQGGLLAARLREAEQGLVGLTGFHIKMVERGGSKLSDLLPNSNPWAGGNCGREGCITCGQGGDRLPDCFKRSILYESACTPCNPGGIKPGDKEGGLEDKRLEPSIYVG